MTTLRGRCACGAVGYVARVDRMQRRFCGCPLCRQQPAARVVAGVILPPGGLHWTGAAPLLYAAPDRGCRAVCGVCGSTLATWTPGGRAVDLDAHMLEDDGTIGCRSHVRALPRDSGAITVRPAAASMAAP
jgi:hypothetical protein